MHNTPTLALRAELDILLEFENLHFRKLKIRKLKYVKCLNS